MENLPPGKGSGASDVSGESSDSTLQLNIKTLDSRIFSFHVDKNILVSAFKETIARQVGVPVGLQRLIFRGKVLKDEHLLSEYNVEHGDTLHLVERQPQPSPGPNTGEATSRNSTGGQDSTAGGPRNRIGQIAHSVILGTLNVGDPGEAVAPDLSRVIGAVLSSIGIGNLAGGMQPGVQTSHGNETERSQGQSPGGYQFGPFQALHGQSASYPMQNPAGAAIAVPSLNMPIPDSLITLTEFMNRMELALSQNGAQQNQSPTASGSLPTPELPTNPHGYPTVEALTIVLRHAQRLLSDHVVPALSQTAGRLDQEGGSIDPAVRGQVQTESVQLGVAMQHLGALLLELGRTILTLRIEQFSGESFVIAGPAVYISPSGPNPIMVQPFPLQTSSLFGGSSGVTQNHVGMGPVASVQRNVNIHIHTGAALASTIPMVGNRAPNGEEMRGQRVNGASGEFGQAQVPSGVNVTTTAVPLRPAIISVSGAIQPGAGVTQATDPNSMSSIVADINAQLRSLAANRQSENQPGAGVSQASDPSSMSSIVADINAQLRNLAPNRQSENQAPSGGSDNQEQPDGCGVRDDDTSSHQRNSSSSIVGETTQTSLMDNQKAKTDPSTSPDGGSHNRSNVSGHAESLEGPSGSNQGNNIQDGSSGLPLGLGLGGLQPKRRVKPQAKNSDGASSSQAVGQHVLQSLASSLSTRGDSNPPASGRPSDLARGVLGNMPTGRQNTDDNIDIADAVSQVLGSPSLDGLLTGVSQQTGVDSPDMLRNMLQQFTQNPAMMNAVNQIAQQIDGHGLRRGLDGGGQGGGFDISRMMQQMMPIVSQALGGISSSSQPNPPSEQVFSGNSLRTDMALTNDDPRIDPRQVVQRLEVQSSSEEIFRSLVNMALRPFSIGSAEECIVIELCSQSELAQEFMEILLLDLAGRLQDEMGF